MQFEKLQMRERSKRTVRCRDTMRAVDKGQLLALEKGIRRPRWNANDLIHLLHGLV